MRGTTNRNESRRATTRPGTIPATIPVFDLIDLSAIRRPGDGTACSDGAVPHPSLAEGRLCPSFPGDGKDRYFPGIFL